MTIRDLTRRVLAGVLAMALALAAQTGAGARAEMVSTGEAIQKYAGPTDRAGLLAELERAEIRDRLVAMGIDPAEAEARLAALSDAEIAGMVAQMQADTAGGNPIVGALLTVFVILLVTDLLCLTSVFSFTRCAR